MKSKLFGAFPAIAVIALSILLGYALANDFRAGVQSSLPWLDPVVTPAEFSALDWVRSNTSPHDKFVSCIFEGEFITAHTLRYATEGGDWAAVPDPVAQLTDVSTIFSTNDSQTAWQLARKYNATLVWVPDRKQFCGFLWEYPSDAKFGNTRFFAKAFSNGGVTIYRLQDNPFEASQITIITGKGS